MTDPADDEITARLTREQAAQETIRARIEAQEQRAQEQKAR